MREEHAEPVGMARRESSTGFPYKFRVGPRMIRRNGVGSLDYSKYTANISC